MDNVIGLSVTGLARFIHQGLRSDLEPSRVARAGYAIIASGSSIRAPLLGMLLGSFVTVAQQADGGWSDVEETVWCLAFLATSCGQYSNEIGRGKSWLSLQQLSCGGWGRSSRDRPRVPITSLVCALVPEVIDRSTLEWLEREWESNLESQVQLTYKAGFYLLAQGHPLANGASDLVEHTVQYLICQQEDDGGFGPWKGHPLGSDPWSTGVVLWGLSQLGERAPAILIKAALSWLRSKQLADGSWPYHYVDDGTSMALIGIASNMHHLKE